MLSPTTNLGLGVLFGFHWEDIDVPAGPQEPRTGWSLGLQPDLRLYRSVTGPVLGFISVSASLYYQKQNGQLSPWAVGVGGGAGIGAEWFPADGMIVQNSL